MKTALLLTGFLILIGVEILRVYFIMPFPGSQQKNTIDLAYWLHNNINWVRIITLLLLLYPAVQMFKSSRRWKKGLLVLVFALYALIFFFFNYRFQADKMFYQPGYKQLAVGKLNTIPLDKLAIGITLNGETKAYPIQLIGYHHQVRDTVGNTPLIVTYCTVCRTGRVFSPVIDGRNETFRLVGMDHFNAMFEDQTTKSWWQQATGIAIAGPLKGKALQELPSKQMTLAAWLSQYPAAAILQPDSSFAKQYEDLDLFDKGTIKSGLEKRDAASWKDKSWVIGIDQNSSAKAYDWNLLIKEKMIEDSLPGLPLLITLAKDSINFYVFNRNVNGISLHFDRISTQDSMMDRNTSSIWSIDGLCIAGKFKGSRLQPVQAYQEFWHSWRTFHPGTKKF